MFSAPADPLIEGRARLFTLGVYPLGDDNWLWPGDDLEALKAEKERLWREARDAVFAALPESLEAQIEVFDLIRAECGLSAPSAHEPVLWQAAREVAEDLVIMQPSPDGWRLTAASLSFPSSWSLREKLGRPLDVIHAPVPGFGPGTRNANVMARMLDNLRPEMPVQRWNYSLNADPALYHPHHEPAPRFGGADEARNVWIRYERQTLRKMPRTGAIVFGIRILHRSLDALDGTPEGEALAWALKWQIETLTPEQTDYKGLTKDHAALLARLGKQP